MTADDRVEQMRQLARHALGGELSEGRRVPLWVRGEGVAAICLSALRRSAEIELAAVEQIVLASLGIDLLEADGVSADTVAAQFGPQVAEWISDCGHRAGTSGLAASLARVAGADEELRLLKSAALAEDLLDVAYRTHDKTPKWIRSTFLPMAQETRAALSEVPYVRFRMSGAYLTDIIDGAWERLQAALRSADGQDWAQGSGVRQAGGPRPPMSAADMAKVKQLKQEDEEAIKRLFGGRNPFSTPPPGADR